MIVRVKGGWMVKSGDGSKNLGGPYKNKADAHKRLAEVEWFKAHNELDTQGGEKPNISVVKLRKADFITYPKDVKGSNCSNCSYNEKGVCQNEVLKGQKVTARNCCGLWDRKGTLRDWESKDKKVANQKSPIPLEVVEPEKQLRAVKEQEDEDFEHERKGPHSMMLQHLTCNLGGPIRHETMAGKDYFVVPVAMITEGVHNGSRGPLYYPEDEIKRTCELWNHKPILVYHPELNGQGVSACNPDVLTRQQVGILLNTAYDGKLRSEAWLEKARLPVVDERIKSFLENYKKGSTMEVSTGLYTNNEKKEGEWNGEKYGAIARDHKPDHLALLPDREGACSVKDGAGLAVTNEASLSEDDQEELVSYNSRWPAAKRHALPKADFAGPGESFPIKSQKDVHSAASLAHHAKDPEEVKGRIKAIAKRKGLKIPKEWEKKPAENQANDLLGGEISDTVQGDRPISSPEQGDDPNVVQVGKKKKKKPTNNTVTLSHDHIRRRLQQELHKQHKNNGGKPYDMESPYVHDVYHNFFVYSGGKGHGPDQFHKQPYKITEDGQVMFGKDDPVQVNKYVEYRTNDNKYVGTTNQTLRVLNEKGIPMTVEEKIDQLIENEVFPEEDREFLGTWNEERLDRVLNATMDDEEEEEEEEEKPKKKMSKNAKKGDEECDDEEEKPKKKMSKNAESTPPHGAAKKDSGNPKTGKSSAGLAKGAEKMSKTKEVDEEEEEAAVRKGAGSPKEQGSGFEDENDNSIENMSAEDFIENHVPPALREVFSEGLATNRAQKGKLIKVLTANEACPYSEEELQGKSLNELNGLYALANSGRPPQKNGTARPPLFTGNMGGAPVVTNKNGQVKQQAVPVPTWNFEAPGKEASKGKK